MSVVRRGLRLTPRLAGWLVGAWLLLVVIEVANALVGAWTTAPVLALVLVVGGLTAWVEHVEGRRSAPDAEIVMVVDRRVVAELDHVKFAQALSAVAGAYLDECERRAGLVDEDAVR